jgi:hypothetical protein
MPPASTREDSTHECDTGWSGEGTPTSAREVTNDSVTKES